MKLLLLLLTLPALAQMSGKFYATGATFQTYSHPELTGWASVAIPLDQMKMNWSYSSYEAIPAAGKPFTLQTSTRTGFATQVKSFGPLLIFALVDGGFATTGTQSGGVVNGGFVTILPLGKKKIWNILGAAQVTKTQVSSGSPKSYKLGFGRSF